MPGGGIRDRFRSEEADMSFRASVTGMAAVFMATAGAAIADLDACAALAGDPDVRGEAGTAFKDIDPARAIPACAAAVAEAPDDVLSAFRLGRAHLAAEHYDVALPLIRRAAEAEYPSAVNLLGLVYFNGWGVEQDREAAFAEILRAHDLGLARATFNVGWFHITGTVVKQDEVRGRALYAEAAERGFLLATYALSLRLWEDNGAPADPAEAARLLREAVDGGHGPAQADLAWRLMNGHWFDEDDAEGYRFAVLAADQGDTYGAFLAGFALEHGQGVEADPAAALARYEAAASGGEAFGQVALGRLLAMGRGVPADPGRARELFRAASDTGDPEATAWLGRLLAFGQGGPRDLGAALPLLEASSGQSASQHALGLLTWQGTGVEQDRAEGLRLIRQAANAGFADAQLDAASILSADDTEAQFRDKAAAVDYLARAAAQNDPRGLLRYGIRLFDGDGVPKDVERGMAMVDRAVKFGLEEAVEVAALLREMKLLDEARAELERQQCQRQITLCNELCSNLGDAA